MASRIAPYRLLRRGCRAGLLAVIVSMAAVLHACAPAVDDAPRAGTRQTAAPASSPSAGGSSAPPPVIRTLEPDLSVTPMRERYIVGEGDARVLRYSTTVLNAGEGPLELVGAYDPAAGAFVAAQRTAMSDGGVAEEEVGRFSFHPDHGHWHFDDFTLLEVWTTGARGEPDAVALSTGKGTFCAVDEVPELPGAGPPVYFACGEGVQGISAGWSDTYGAEIPGQELPLGSLPDGDYVLRSTVDPDGRLRESDDDNNSTDERVRIAGSVIEPLE